MPPAAEAVGQLQSEPSDRYGSSLDGRLTKITAAEQSFTVGYRRAAVRQLTDSTHQRHSQDRFACRNAVVQHSAKGRRVDAHRRSKPNNLAFGVAAGKPFDMVPTESENRSTDE